jgi:hypothetical protein
MGGTANWNVKIERKGRDTKEYPKRIEQKRYRRFEGKRKSMERQRIYSYRPREVARSL